MIAFTQVFTIFASLFPSSGQRYQIASETSTVLNVRKSLVSRHLQNSNRIFQFDDIPTTKGIATVPSPYSYLSFSQYDVIAPRDPAWKDKISPNDLNCAVSTPNALIGSRYSSGRLNSLHGARFEIANATAMAAKGLSPSFTLVSLNVKPLDAPDAGTTVYITGYSKERSKPLTWNVEFPLGYHLPLLVKLAEFSGTVWDSLYAVEITADFGEDALDWEFCIDDLKIQFHEHQAEHFKHRLPNQAILSEGRVF